MAKKKEIKTVPTSKTYQKNLAESCEEWIKIFGANKNLYRITPSMQDGLKPVHRRFIYTLYTGRGRKDFIKMAKAASDTVAEYHPHGNVSVEEVGASLATPISNNICCVEGRGNFGSYKNEKAGAARYIECKLSKYAQKCFFEDYASYNVDTRPAYTGYGEEPEYLPARYPHALFNPQMSGIGYGFSSSIPPYNLKEVMKATIKLIKNPDADIILIPDSPTGADVVDDGQFGILCTEGIGTFTLRGSIEVDEIKNTITITSIPLQVTIDSIIRKIAELKDKKVFDEILSIKDYTKNATGVRTVIEISPTANPYNTIEKLYKKNIGLSKTYSVRMRLVDDFKDYDYGVISFLKAWIDYRRDCIRGMYNTKLVRAIEKQNINDVMIFITNKENAETTIKIARTSEDIPETAKRFMAKYDIDSQQAMAVAHMNIHAFNKSAHRRYLENRETLRKDIAEYEAILDNDDKIDEIIVAQLEEGIKLFGSPRKSKVVTDDGDVISNTNHIIGISTDGYVKKVPIEEKQIGQIGNKSYRYLTLNANNRDSLLVFDSTGIISRVPVASIADMTLKNRGVPLERYIPIHGNVVAALIEPTAQEMKKLGRNMYFTFLTKYGYVKKTLLEHFSNLNGCTTAIKLVSGDALVAADFTMENSSKDMVIYTNQGNGIRIDINEFPVMKPNARGTKQISLVDDEVCVGFDKISPGKSYILYMTSSGRCKRTEMKYFPAMKRGDNVLSLINLDKTDSLVGLCSVRGDEEIIAYMKSSKPQSLYVADVPVSTRAAKAEKMIKTPRGDCVLAYNIR